MSTLHHNATKKDADDWMRGPQQFVASLELCAVPACDLTMPPVGSYDDKAEQGGQDEIPPVEVYGVPSEPAIGPRRPKPSSFRLLRAGELEFRPPAWRIRGFLEADSLGLVFGDPGHGKSFVAIDIASCIATGTDFHGRSTEAGPVIYLAGEGHNGLKRRIRAWELHNNQSLDDAPLYVSPAPAALCDSTSALSVLAAVDEIAEAHAPPALVVIDTVARNFGPGDENSTQDMGKFIQAVDGIRTRYKGCTVLLLHHTGHADKSRARGAMALKGALDAEYRMEKDGSGVVRFEATKMKDGPIPEPMAFRLCSIDLGVQDEEGEAVTSAVLELTNYEPPPTKAGKPGRGKWQAVALQQLERLRREHRKRVEDSGRDPAAARVALEDWRVACQDASMPRQRFNDVKTALHAQGLVDIDHGFIR